MLESPTIWYSSIRPELCLPAPGPFSETPVRLGG